MLFVFAPATLNQFRACGIESQEIYPSQGGQHIITMMCCFGVTHFERQHLYIPQNMELGLHRSLKIESKHAHVDVNIRYSFNCRAATK